MSNELTPLRRPPRMELCPECGSAECNCYGVPVFLRRAPKVKTTAKSELEEMCE